ncbi:hypothetical protein AAG570_005770 [Ranatra chinensis]|uniref:Rab-GAP TBC domain-containing protein n=1 Tax=Ranatra chinensis TaxID=642074 RepID=A0ABD0Y0Z4_9HEMI
MKDCGMETVIKNKVFHWVRSHKNNPLQKEPVTYLRKAQLQWEKRIHKSLNSMAAEIKVNLAQLRHTADREELEDKWNELSIYDIELSQYRPVYAPKDFLEVLLCIRNPNYRTIDRVSPWEFVHFPLKVKTLGELRALYQEVARGEPLLGVDPNVRTHQSFPSLMVERTLLGEKVINRNHAPVTQEFLKKGAPRSLRAKLWAQVMGTEVTASDRQRFNELKKLVLKYDLVVDKLIIKDIQLTASNDHQYFVFEDLLYQVLLCFMRDTEVLSVFNGSASNPVHGILKGRNPTLENTVVYPPSGVIPFHGFTMFATPFCYLYDDPVELYFIFRAFYMRYWYRLHEVSSNQQGILSLCVLFERLLHRYESELWQHFKKNGIQPIRVAFKWIMRAFSGHLPPEQVLFLWDMILAYDSLEVLPLLAVTVLSLRRDNLLAVDNFQNTEVTLFLFSFRS